MTAVLLRKTEREYILAVPRKEADKNQLNFLRTVETDKIKWMSESLEIALTLREFFPSELYQRLVVQPAHCNWYGAMFGMLRAHGYYIDRSVGRKSPTESANGRWESLWRRKAVV